MSEKETQAQGALDCKNLLEPQRDSDAYLTGYSQEYASQEAASNRQQEINND